jgi:hypothetical protein
MVNCVIFSYYFPTFCLQVKHPQTSIEQKFIVSCNIIKHIAHAFVSLMTINENLIMRVANDLI